MNPAQQAAAIALQQLLYAVIGNSPEVKLALDALRSTGIRCQQIEVNTFFCLVDGAGAALATTRSDESFLRLLRIDPDLTPGESEK